MTVEELRTKLNELGEGVLYSGTHLQNTQEFCALEFSHAVRNHPHQDTPGDLPDLRQLNDGSWSSNEARTNAFLPMMATLWDWQIWTPARQQRWIEYVVIQTITRIISQLPQLPHAIQVQCQNVRTLQEAKRATVATETAAEAMMARTIAEAAEAGKAAVTAAEMGETEEATAVTAEAMAVAAEAMVAETVSYFDACKTRDYFLNLACVIWKEGVAQSVKELP